MRHSEDAMAQQTADGAEPHVAGWTDILGSWLERHPQAFIRLGNWETRLLEDRIRNLPIRSPIYIAGLARSGSTILLELLSRHPELATHRYRDFPLLLTPWIWNWFVDRAATRPQVASERAHRDRIAVTAESPEAFEEVVWMAFFRHLHDPAANAVLDDADNPTFEAFYRDHIRKMLLIRGGTRYLAKGNYNVTRLPYLLKLFPDARFIVPVRDPEWHIASLMKQHALFCREERRNPRVLRHMRRSGHFEFGLDRRATHVGDAEATARIERLWRSGQEVAGWAEHWRLVYGHLARTLEDRPDLRAATVIVRYEDLCARPAEVLAGILARCDLPPHDLPAEAQARVAAPGYYRPSFTAEERGLIRDITRDAACRFGYEAPGPDDRLPAAPPDAA
ncbi:sulfotransferase [Inquilinus limosus]